MNLSLYHIPEDAPRLILIQVLESSSTPWERGEGSMLARANDLAKDIWVSIQDPQDLPKYLAYDPRNIFIKRSDKSFHMEALEHKEWTHEGAYHQTTMLYLQAAIRNYLAGVST